MKAFLFGALLVRALNAQGLDDFLTSPDVTTTEETLAPLITPGVDALSEADLLSPNPGVDINDVGEAASVIDGLGAEITPSLDDLTSEVTPIIDAIPLELPIGTADVIVDTSTFDPSGTTLDALGPAETAVLSVGDTFDTTGWNWPTAEAAPDTGFEPTETLTVDNSGFEELATAIDEGFPAATEAAPEINPSDPSTDVDDVPIDDSGAVLSDTDVFGAVPTAADDFGLEPTAAPEFDPNGETELVADAVTDDLGLVDIPTATEDLFFSGESTVPADVDSDPGAGFFDSTTADDTFASATDAAAAAITDSTTLDLGLGDPGTPTLNLVFTNFPAVLSDISDLIFPTPMVDLSAGVPGDAGVGGLAASEDPADAPLSDDLAAVASSDELFVDVPMSEDLALATLTSDSGVAAFATDVPAELTAMPPQPGLVASTAPTATDSAAALSDPDVTPGPSSDDSNVSGQSAEGNNVDAQGVQGGGSGGFSGEDTGVYDGQDYGEDWGDDSQGVNDWDDGGWGGKGGKGGKGSQRPHPDLKDCPWWCFEDGNDPGPEAWVGNGPIIKRPQGERPPLKREEPASGGFESFNYPNTGENDGPGGEDEDIPEWLWDQSGKKPPRPGPAKQCPWKCYHPRPQPTRIRTHHPRPTTRRPWTRTHTWHPWTSTDYPESSTAEPVQTTTTTFITKTKTRHHHSPFTSVLASDIDWTGDTLATICPKTCDPFNPQLNFCDSQTTGCTTTGGKNYYCACRAGYRASKWNAKDFSKQFHVPGQPYVYVAPGVVCDKLCGDQTCSDVLLRPHCL